MKIRDFSRDPIHIGMKITNHSHTRIGTILDKDDTGPRTMWFVRWGKEEDSSFLCLLLGFHKLGSIRMSNRHQKFANLAI